MCVPKLKKLDLQRAPRSPNARGGETASTPDAALAGAHCQHRGPSPHQKKGSVSHTHTSHSIVHDASLTCIRTPDYSSVSRRKCCPRQLHTMFTTLLTPPQQLALPLEARSKRIPERDEQSGRVAGNSALFRRLCAPCCLGTERPVA